MLYWIIAIALGIALSPIIIPIAFVSMFYGLMLAIAFAPALIAFTFPELGSFRLILFGLTGFFIYVLSSNSNDTKKKKKDTSKEAQVDSQKNKSDAA